jgi:hypothetical protein
MRRNISEALHLTLLGQQREDRVERQLDKRKTSARRPSEDISQTGQSNLEQPVVVELPGPLGDRVVVDRRLFGGALEDFIEI